MNNNNKKITDLSFEEALAELEKIVAKLESGKESLETAINDYEYGNALREYCEKRLEEAKLKIEKIVRKEDGSITTEPQEIV
ncbi:MAG: exodeoxyribonuclease VII small subunit [Rickettsiales bacterium]|nr:exodeoxyribonuclease VII small subunit [Rickettsiales bacterium]